MLKYQVLQPDNLDETVHMLNQCSEDSILIAGGTDLLVQIREKNKKVNNINKVIDLSKIEGINYILDKNDEIHIGPRATHTKISESELLNKFAPLLVKACLTVGSPQIRNRGTIGGGIGNASPASDVIPPLIALNADIVLKSVEGQRTVKLKNLITGSYKTDIKKNEIIVDIYFKKLTQSYKSDYYKLGRRKALAISRLDLAVIANQNSSKEITDIRIVPGAVFECFDHAVKAENKLLGKIPTNDLIDEASRLVVDEMIERTGIRWSTEYKKEALPAIAKRMFKTVLEVD